MATNKYANSTNVVESIYSAKRKFYSIRPIVEKYFQLRENNIIDGALIKVKDKSFPFKSFFKGVYKQNIDEHRDYAHIYWGKGYIRRLGNSDGYIVFFEREMRVEESLISPSIIITEAALNAYPLSTRLKYYLNAKTIESNTKFIVFVYGIPCKKVINGNNHINFVIENLDFIDFRSTKYYEKLKRKAGAA